MRISDWSSDVGSSDLASWRGMPVFIRNLTAAEQAAAAKVPLSELRDPQTLAERTKEGHRNLLVTIGICTHLGCVPLGAAEGENRGDYGGYFCPCHGSHYDTAARVRNRSEETTAELQSLMRNSYAVLCLKK